MTIKILTDNTGTKIGEVKNEFMRMAIYDKSGTIRGSYYPGSNTTYNRYGSAVGSGNLLGLLLEKPIYCANTCF